MGKILVDHDKTKMSKVPNGLSKLQFSELLEIGWSMGMKNKNLVAISLKQEFFLCIPVNSLKIYLMQLYEKESRL